MPPPYAADLPIYFVEVMGYRDRQEDLYPSLFSEIGSPVLRVIIKYYV
jgi:hypothetical protein